jgi:hypothetical protein
MHHKQGQKYRFLQLEYIIIRMLHLNYYYFYNQIFRVGFNLYIKTEFILILAIKN